MAETIIEVNQLRKQYGEITAVHDVSFSVKKGDIFGIVGPNGAGKTTTVECLEGLRQASSGSLRILGLDPWKHKQQLKMRLGIQLQESLLPDRIRVKEALDVFAKIYGTKANTMELLERLGLAEKAKANFDALSGGQKQRLSIAMALVHSPEIVFFDELTTGLDPQARRSIWELVEEIRNQGTTVVLVTHFMEEAERLCDQLAIIDSGRVVALNTPSALIQSLNKNMSISFECTEQVVDLLNQSGKCTNVTQHDKQVNCGVISVKDMADIVYLLDSHSVTPEAFAMHKANLEDVFIHFTGKSMRD